jgi:hypothetical protein
MRKQPGLGSAVQVEHLDRAGLGAAVADLPVPQSADLAPGQPGQRAAQRGLVGLDGEQVVGAAVVQVVGVGALAVQRVRGDHDTAQVIDGVQRRGEGGHLVCAVHLDLRQRQVIGVVEDRDQLGLPPRSSRAPRSVLPSTASTIRSSSRGRTSSPGGRRRVSRRVTTHPVRARCSAAGSTAASTRPNVVACGVGPTTATACSAQPAHWAIAAYERAPASTAPIASSRTDCRL